MNKVNPDKSLTALLQDWKIDTELPPRFPQEVWRRIAEREADALSTSWSARFKQWLAGVNGGRDFAWGALAAMIVTAGAGWMGLRTGGNSSHASLSPDSYLSSVDPYHTKR